MKIAITGKGGSGKTTLAAGLSLLYSQDKKTVIAVDCDPDMNLGLSLGFPHPEKITAITSMHDLIAKRTESDLDRPSGYFKLNPKVDDIPLKFCPEQNNIRLIVMGKVNKAAGGCLCPENTFVRRLIEHLVIGQKEIVILDMVAGSEHLGRGTAEGVDAFLIVVEPNLLSINTGLHIKSLAKELGIKKIYFIANKVYGQEDIAFIEDSLQEKLTGSLSFNKSIQNKQGRLVMDDNLKKEFQEIFVQLKRKL